MPASKPVELRDASDLDMDRWLRPGDRIVVSQGPAEPTVLTQALVDQRARFGPLSIFVGPIHALVFRPEHGDHIAFSSYCGSAANHAFIEAGVLDVLPSHYSLICAMYESGERQADVVLVLLADDGWGGFNTGLMNDYVISAARRARVIIAEVSDRVPCTPGGEWPADLVPDAIIRTSREPVEVSRGIPGEVEQRLAGHVASLVPDGATIEIGIGALPDMVLKALSDHKDLGLHSGAISDGVVELMEKGVITNARKSIDAGVCVAGLLFGSRRLFDFVDRNKAVRLAPPAYTHCLSVMGSLPNFIAINGAVEVDLTGQINGESAGGRYVGAVGGQVDFARGAAQSHGGRSIIMLGSTARRGRVTRIVPRLPDGVVSTARSDADTIVTEWGVAELKGRTISERIKRMIAIADPAFRDDLERAARRLPEGRT